jgi:hypothetical protein
VRVRVVIATAALAALSPVVVPTGIASAASRCSARGSITVAASVTARIYTVPKRDSNGRLRNLGPLPGQTFGCLYRNNKRVALGVRGDRVLGSFHLASHFVAFTASGRALAAQAVEVVDLARRRMTLRNSATDAGVSDLALAASGSLAWIRSAQDGTASVSKFESGAGVTLVDPGPAIGRHSLGLGGSTLQGYSATVYWTTPSGPRSAPLR